MPWATGRAGHLQDTWVTDVSSLNQALGGAMQVGDSAGGQCPAWRLPRAPLPASPVCRVLCSPALRVWWLGVTSYAHSL